MNREAFVPRVRAVDEEDPTVPNAKGFQGVTSVLRRTGQDPGRDVVQRAEIDHMLERGELARLSQDVDRPVSGAGCYRA